MPISRRWDPSAEVGLLDAPAPTPPPQTEGSARSGKGQEKGNVLRTPRSEGGERRRGISECKVARRTGRFPQLVDPRGRVSGLLLTRSPRFREVSLEERPGLCRLKQSEAAHVHPPAACPRQPEALDQLFARLQQLTVPEWSADLLGERDEDAPRCHVIHPMGHYADSKCGRTFRELVTRQVSSAFVSSRRAWSSFAPDGTLRRARTSSAVNWVTRSIRSTVPVTPHSNDTHDNRDTGDAAEGQHEAVRDGGHEQGLWRPPVAGPAELCGRRRRNRQKPLALQGDVAWRVCLRHNRIVMRKLLHAGPLISIALSHRANQDTPADLCLATRRSFTCRRLAYRYLVLALNSDGR